MIALTVGARLPVRLIWVQISPWWFFLKFFYSAPSSISICRQRFSRKPKWSGPFGGFDVFVLVDVPRWLNLGPATTKKEPNNNKQKDETLCDGGINLGTLQRMCMCNQSDVEIWARENEVLGGNVNETSDNRKKRTKMSLITDFFLWATVKVLHGRNCCLV